MRALILAAALLAATVHVQTVRAQTVLIEESVLGFSVPLGERRVEGRFETWSAMIDGEAGRIEVTVEIGSATTGDALIDAVMLGEGWLAARAHPRGTFRSEIVVEGEAGGTASGVLSVAGEDLPLDVAIRAVAPHRYEARASIDRRMLGIGPDGPPVGPTVEIGALVTVAP